MFGTPPFEFLTIPINKGTQLAVSLPSVSRYQLLETNDCAYARDESSPFPGGLPIGC